jgi:hypothetical protein
MTQQIFQKIMDIMVVLKNRLLLMLEKIKFFFFKEKNINPNQISDFKKPQIISNIKLNFNKKYRKKTSFRY